jgi:hypothetical protein
MLCTSLQGVFINEPFLNPSMLTTDTFNKIELEQIKRGKRSSYNYTGIFLKIFLPLSFALGSLGIIFHHGYWESTLFFVSGFSIAAIYLTMRPRNLFAKDLKEKIKYMGTVTVLEKSNKNNEWKVYLDSREIKRLNIHLENIYNQIDVGSELYLEIAKNSRLIFQLKKGNVWLFRNG